MTMLKGKFKVGDRIMYRGYMYEISQVERNWYVLEAIPPYDMEDGIVKSIGPGGEDDMTRVPEDHQMTVAELIHELYKFNPKALVCGGGNFGNRIELSWGYSDGCTKENCEYVCINNVADSENTHENE